jgi:hypothetical protein
VGKFTLLTEASQFRTGLVCGLVAMAVVFVVAAARMFGPRPAVAGLAFCTAALAVLQGWGPWKPAHALPNDALIAIAVLAVGGIGVQVLRPGRNLATSTGLFVPGGVLLALSLPERTPLWASMACAVAVVAGSALGAELDHYHRRRSLGPMLLLVSVVGVYLTVPDTEGARALVGAAIPLVLVVLPRPAATLGAAGLGASLGVLGWITVVEGLPRPGSIVGGLGCFGLFVAEPLARRYVPGLRERDGHGPFDHWRNTAVATGVQAVVVLWASRVAGFAHDAVPAAFALVPAFGAGMLLSRLIPAPPLPGQRVRRR